MRTYTYKVPLGTLALYALLISWSNDISKWWYLVPAILLLGFLALAGLLKSLR